jgi:hypothetical protein
MTVVFTPLSLNAGSGSNSLVARRPTLILLSRLPIRSAMTIGREQESQITSKLNCNCSHFDSQSDSQQDRQMSTLANTVELGLLKYSVSVDDDGSQQTQPIKLKILCAELGNSVLHLTAKLTARRRKTALGTSVKTVKPGRIGP